MWKHYLKSAWRNVKKGKLYSIINIAGLSIGLAAGIMLLLWVQNESGYDKFLENADQIYRVNTHFKGQQNAGKEVVYDRTPPQIAVAARSISAVNATTRIMDNGEGLFKSKNQTKAFKCSSSFVDDNFLSVFSYQLLKGDRGHLWSNPDAIVLTESVAKKLLGDAFSSPVGQVVDYDGKALTVTGVLADFPQNSTMQADMLLPMSYYAAQYKATHDNKTLDGDRQNFGMETYVRLLEKASADKVAGAFTKTWTDLGDKRFEFQLQPLTTIHLVQPNGDKSAYRLVQIFLVIVVMLFLIASINYVNISTARSLTRAKEVGVKKIIGAKKSQLFFQFIWETALIFAISVFIAIGLIFALMPLYNYISGKALNFALGNITVWTTLLAVIIGTLLVASIYPAVLLSSFKPLNSLKGKLSKNLSANSFRKALVVFQFFMAAVLLFVTIVMGRQLDYLRNINIGYDKDYVFTVAFPEAAIPHLEAIKSRLSHNSNIASIGISNAENLSALYVSTTGMKWQGKDPNSTFFIYTVSIDGSFIPTMKMPLIAGKNFSDLPSDSSGIILNQTAIAQMGLKAPYVGQSVHFGARTCNIIGVVKDFNFQSLKTAISPLVFYVNPDSRNTLYVRTSQKHMKKAIAAVAAAYGPYRTNEQPFSYEFLDQQFEYQYHSDNRVGALFIAFASIAIFISCLGLFGLATYSAASRVKEMGIRKVLGASVGSIVALICKEFVGLVLLAVLISAPLSYWLADKWLHNFAYQTRVGAGVFAKVLMILTVITFSTISIKIYRTAKSNLLAHLKSE